MRILSILWLLLLNPLISDSFAQQQITKIKPNYTDKLFETRQSTNSPGASIAIVKNQKMVYSQCYGLANLEYNIPITSHSIFHAASLSKQFTAFAVLMLAHQGKLSLDDDIRKYLPQMPDFGNTIYIQHLLYHTSGLRDQWDLLMMAGWRPDDVITEEQILKMVRNQQELNFKPGEDFQYSNTNYTLLAKIVENISGEDFTTWTRKRIFRPLGMQNTFFYDNHTTIVKNRAYSYTKKDGVYEKMKLNYSTVGATSLFTTAEDLAKWAINFETLTLGSPSIMEQMHKTGILNNGEKTDYAAGLGKGYHNGQPMIYHGGSDAGYRCYFIRFPKQQLTVLFLGNSASFNPRKKALQISDLYLPHASNPNSLKKYEGIYKINRNMDLKIWVAKNSELQAQISGKQDVHKLIHSTGSTFNIPTLNANIEFAENENGKTEKIIMNKNGQQFIAQKKSISERKKTVNNLITIPDSVLNNYIGKYELQKPLHLEIRLQNHQLKAQITGKHDIHPLIPITQTQFDVPSLNMMVDFQKETNQPTNVIKILKDNRTIHAPKKCDSSEIVDLKNYTGRYFSEELSTFYSFIIQDGQLIARHQRHSDIKLIQLEKDYLQGNRIFKYIEVIRNQNQEISGIKVSTGNIRELWFDKTE